MAYFLAFVLFIGLASGFLTNCPVVTCANIGYNLCASFDGSSFSINSQNCTSGYHCSVNDVYDWISLKVITGDVTGTLWCSSETFQPGVALANATQVTCGTRDTAANLQVGSHPKVCESSLDCLLQNGQYSNCDCGMSGQTYCVPELGSTVMDNFWSSCNNYTNVINATQYEYWVQYRSLYILQKTQPTCALTLFDEFQYLAAGVSAANWWGLAGAIVVLTIS